MLAFRDCLLDGEGRLSRAGRRVHLPPKEAAVLRVLAEEAGRAVSKAELCRRVWNDAAISDESLARCVYALRAALEDDGRPRRFIETAHGRGYRFVADVRAVAGGEPSGSWLERAARASPRVYETFLQARFLWHRRSPANLAQAVKMLEQVIDWDARFAPAHELLAACHVVRMWWGQGAPVELAPKITEAASHALALDGALTTAKASIGYVRSLVDRAPAEADVLFAEALTADPASPLARHFHPLHLAAQGRFEAACESARVAVDLDPFSQQALINLGYTLHLARRSQAALEVGQSAIELDPAFGPAYGVVAFVQAQLGRTDAALEAARAKLELAPQAPGARAGLALALAQAGRAEEAVRIVEDDWREAHRRYIVPAAYAFPTCARGERERAFAWLALAAEQRCCWLGCALADPCLDPLRSDPRFGELVALVRGAPSALDVSAVSAARSAGMRRRLAGPAAKGPVEARPARRALRRTTVRG